MPNGGKDWPLKEQREDWQMEDLANGLLFYNLITLIQYQTFNFDNSFIMNI